MTFASYGPSHCSSSPETSTKQFFPHQQNLKYLQHIPCWKFISKLQIIWWFFSLYLQPSSSELDPQHVSGLHQSESYLRSHIISTASRSFLPTALQEYYPATLCNTFYRPGHNACRLASALTVVRILFCSITFNFDCTTYEIGFIHFSFYIFTKFSSKPAMNLLFPVFWHLSSYFFIAYTASAIPVCLLCKVVLIIFLLCPQSCWYELLFKTDCAPMLFISCTMQFSGWNFRVYRSVL